MAEPELQTPDSAQDNGPAEITRPAQFPTATKIENGVAYDISGKALGSVAGMQTAAPKPKFDPNASYESVPSEQPVSVSQKPKFNPNLPYESVSVGEQPAQPKPANYYPFKGPVDLITGKPTEGVFPQWLQTGLEKTYDAGKLISNKMIEPFAKAAGEAGEQVATAALHPVEFVKHPLRTVSSKELVAKTEEEHPYVMGSAKATGEFYGGLVSDPRNWPFLASGGLEPLFQKVITGGFAVMMGHGTYEGAKNLIKNWDSLTPMERSEQLTSTGLGAALTALAAHGAIGPEAKTLVGEIAKSGAEVARNAVGGAKSIAGSAVDAFGSLVGKAPDFKTAMKRSMRIAPKQTISMAAKIENVTPELQAILNLDTDGHIVDPKTFADDIEKHRANQIEAPLQKAAGATKDSTEPVVADLEQRVRTRLKEYAAENKGRFSEDDMEAAQDAVIDRIMQRGEQTGYDERTGKPTYAKRAPNLFEAENVRQGLNEDAAPAALGAKLTARNSASFEAAKEVRKIIDEAYDAKNVKKVAESRQKEADLIDIRDALRTNQGRAETLGDGGIFHSITKKLGTPAMIASALLAPFDFGASATSVGAIILGDKISQNLRYPNVNIARAQELAAKNPNATATVPVVGTPPPTPPAAPAPPVPVVPPVTPPAAPAVEGKVDHAMHAALATHHRENIENTTAAELEARFKDKWNSDTANSIPHTPAEVALLEKINQSKATARIAADAAAEKAAKEQQRAAEKAQKEQQRLADKAQKDAEKAAAEAEKAQKEKDEKAAQGLNTNLSIPFETEPEIDIPALYSKTGYTGARLRAHELGHQIMVDEYGYPTGDVISHLHPDASKGAAAEARWDKSSFTDPKTGRFDATKILGSVRDVLGVLHGGAVAEEVVHDIPFEQNRGASGDMTRARRMLKSLGFSPTETGMMMKAAELEARKVMTTPGVAEIIHRYTQAREAGLDETLHMHPETIGKAIQEVRNARGGGNEPTGNEGPDVGGVGEGGGQGNAGGKSKVTPKAAQGIRPAGKAGAGIGEGRVSGRGVEELSNIAKGASEFNRDVGRPEIIAKPIPHNPEVASRIAEQYEVMKHEPQNPAVKASYEAAKKDIDAQWDFATKKMGIKFEPWIKEGQPYANSKEMMADVKNNKHLFFFQGGEIPTDHPLAAVDSKTSLSYNDKLRAVHDLFGHAAHGFQFGPKGEENAWNVHRQMFSPEAVPAITTETRGQNSWVNFGKHLRNAEGKIPTKGEAGYTPPTERPYAQNKAGILPTEFHAPAAHGSQILTAMEKGIGSTDDAAGAKNGASFITPQGKFIHLPAGTHHPEAIRQYGGEGTFTTEGAEKQSTMGDIRPTFLEESGAVRMRHSFGRSGEILQVSVPSQGVTPEQADALRRAVGVVGRNGNLYLERGDVKPDTVNQLTTHKEFVRPSDVDGMLKQINANPNKSAVPNDSIAGEQALRTQLNYVRNPQKAENFGERFGQHVEPAGRYLNARAEGIEAPKGWETGTVEFKKPLVIDWGGGYQESSNWKNVLSKRYGGKTGAALSEAIRKDGYDGIITKFPTGETSEIVDLKPKQWHEQAAETAAKESAGGINPQNPEAESKRYGFEILPEARQTLETAPTAQHFQDYAAKHAAEIGAHPDIKLGWDTAGAKPELNIGASTNDLGTAKNIAAKLDQRALWDNEAKKEIPAGGKGAKTSFPEYPFAQRLIDLKTNAEAEPESFEFGKNVEGTPDQQKGLISTRLPSGPKSNEDPLAQDLRIDRDAIGKVPGMAEKMADLVRDYPGMRVSDNIKDPDKVLDRFEDHVKNNLIQIYKQTPAERQVANMHWYDSANKLASMLADKYGRSTKQLAGVMAALSPQKDWDQNVSLAQRVNDIYHTKKDTMTTPEMMSKGSEIAARPTGKVFAEMTPKLEGKRFADLTEPAEKAAWIRLYDEVHNPREFESIDPATGEGRGIVKSASGNPTKVAWGGLNEIGKAIAILEDGSRENISNNLGDAHKVRNFYNNILDPNNPAGHVTVDTHAVAAGLLRPLGGTSPEVMTNFASFKGAPSSSINGVNGTYPLYADAYRAAARELGLQPRQLQSVVWEEIRNLFPSELRHPEYGHQAAVDDIWRQYGDRKISLDNAHQAVRGYFQKAIEQAQAARQAKGPGKMSAQDFLEAMGQGGLFALGGKK